MKVYDHVSFNHISNIEGPIYHTLTQPDVAYADMSWCKNLDIYVKLQIWWYFFMQNRNLFCVV